MLKNLLSQFFQITKVLIAYEQTFSLDVQNFISTQFKFFKQMLKNLQKYCSNIVKAMRCSGINSFWHETKLLVLITPTKGFLPNLFWQATQEIKTISFDYFKSKFWIWNSFFLNLFQQPTKYLMIAFKMEELITADNCIQSSFLSCHLCNMKSVVIAWFEL